MTDVAEEVAGEEVAGEEVAGEEVEVEEDMVMSVIVEIVVPFRQRGPLAKPDLDGEIAETAISISPQELLVRDAQINKTRASHWLRPG